MAVQGWSTVYGDHLAGLCVKFRPLEWMGQSAYEPVSLAAARSSASRVIT